MNQRVNFPERHKKGSSNFRHLTPKSCHTKRLCQQSTACVIRVVQH